MGEAKAVAADHGAVLDRDAMADLDPLADRHAGVEDAVVADPCAPSDNGVRIQDRARADARPRFDDGERADRGVGRDRGVVGDERARVNAGRRLPCGGEERDRTREREIRVCRPEHRTGGRLCLLAEDDGRSARRPQRRSVLVVGEEGDVSRRRLLDAGHAMHVDRAISFEAALEALGEFTEFQASAV